MASTAADVAPEQAPRSFDQAAYLQALLDHLPVLAIVVSLDGAIVSCNQPAALAFRAARKNAARRRLGDLLGPESAATLLAHPGKATIRASLARGPDDAPAIVEWSSRHLPGEEAQLLIVGRDVQREHQLEDYIVDNQWFETAGALSGGLAHDFNNVLASVLGLSEIIGLRLPQESPLRQFTTKISKGIDRAKVLVRRFTQFSRKPELKVEAQPLGLILDDLCQMLTGFLPGSITFEPSISPDTPWCEADRHTVAQIILNCANFFRTRLREDGGRLEIRSGPVDGAGTRASIAICGSGAGLADLDVDSLFELRTGRTDSAYESGAGLFAAHRLASRTGLALTARRDDPRTITFQIRLPLASR